MSRRNLAAYTDTSRATYPQYVSIEEQDGGVTILARGAQTAVPADPGSPAGAAVHIPGTTACVILLKAEFVSLLQRALDALRVRANIRSALAQPAPVAWTPITRRLPDWTDDPSVRVLIYTGGSDFAGEQFFDVRALDFYLPDESMSEPVGTELTRAATHWMSLPFPDAPPEQAAPEFCRQCGASIPHRDGEGRCPACMNHGRRA